MEFKHYVAIVRRWGWMILFCTVLTAGTSYWFSSVLPRVYAAEARYVIGTVIDNSNVTINDLQVSNQLGKTYTDLVTSQPIIQRMIDRLNLYTDVDTVAQNVTATWLNDSFILSIEVRAADPQLAADMANSLGEILIERSFSASGDRQLARHKAATAQIVLLEKTIQATQAEIDQISNQIQQTIDALTQRALIAELNQRRADLGSTRRALSEQYAILRSTVNQITLVDPAVRNPVPVEPDNVRIVLAALVAGAMLGFVMMVLLEYFVDIIYTHEDLYKATGLAYLGEIARHKKPRKTDTSQLVVEAYPETQAADDYWALRTALQMLGRRQRLSSVLITSPLQGDGKSTIAANLAVTFARLCKRVLLIDANLRSPQIATLFKLPKHDGLSNLLDTSSQLPELLPIDSIPGLWVLPAGTATQNSLELLGSRRMVELIRVFQSCADVVIFDSPPLLYSDALVLAPQVDGVLLVTSSGTTERKNTVEAVDSLYLIGARVIGAVLNRVTPRAPDLYYPSQTRKRSLWARMRRTETRHRGIYDSAGEATRALVATPQVSTLDEVLAAVVTKWVHVHASEGDQHMAPPIMSVVKQAPSDGEKVRNEGTPAVRPSRSDRSSSGRNRAYRRKRHGKSRP
jgi:capsular exopolysaccharide synthesis family protein